MLMNITDVGSMRYGHITLYVVLLLLRQSHRQHHSRRRLLLRTLLLLSLQHRSLQARVVLTTFPFRIAF
jgi:hypothetical protein